MIARNGEPGQTAVENRELWQTADAWAKAVCDRDGNAIVNLSTQQTRENLINEELLSGEGGNYGFGWSSPWPWDSGQGYRIVACTEADTDILYYAWTSDPHVTVWWEHLTWKRERHFDAPVPVCHIYLISWSSTRKESPSSTMHTIVLPVFNSISFPASS